MFPRTSSRNVYAKRLLMGKKKNRYGVILTDIFLERYEPGMQEVDFERSDMEIVSKKLDIDLPKNLGDVIYSYRYRTPLPSEISSTAPEKMEWIIKSRGIGLYRFQLSKINRIIPRDDMAVIKIPDATPEIVEEYSLSDEQSLLAKLRYNRLIDIFLGLVAYSLQNHLRTTVKGIGQIEVDELYVGVDKRGAQYVIPVQAKGGNDQSAVVQIEQDMLFCAERYPQLLVRPIAAQFVGDDKVAMFELGKNELEEIVVIEEKHYQLMSAKDIGQDDLAIYARRI